MAHTASFLLSADAFTGRASRAKQYRDMNWPFQYVVWAETQPNRFEELDAEDLEHAQRLAHAWVIDQQIAMTASIRRVKDGNIGASPIKIIAPEPPEDFWAD